MACNESPDGNRLHECVAEFQKRRTSILAALCGMVRLVLECVRDDYAPTAIVEARIKSASSFAEKCLRKHYREPFKETTDQCAGRIICSTLKEKRALRDALTALFSPVDEYENTTWRHDADSFGYLGYHMVVHFSKAAVQRMAERWPRFAGFPDAAVDGVKFEIQLRTFLEHAHADITHDRLYKSSFDVSGNLMRKSAIVAAQLESADKQLQQLVDAVEEYSAGAAATMKPGAREKEIKCLAALLQPGLEFPDQEALLTRMIRLHRAAWNWKAVVELLQESGGRDGEGLSAELAGELGYAVLRIGIAEKRNAEVERAAAILAAASARARGDFEVKRRERDAQTLSRLLHWQSLAYARVAGRMDEAVECVREAHMLLPADPFILVTLVKAEWLSSGAKPSALAMSLLEGAAVRCVRLAKAGVDSISAWLALSLLRLLQGDARRSFAALALAAEAGAGVEALAAAADDFARAKDLPGGDAAFKALAGHLESATRLVIAGRTQEGRACRGRDFRRASIVMISGNTASGYEGWVASKGGCLAGAFADFPGVVLSGGSPHGVCKLAFECAKAAANGAAVRFRGYLPRNAPAMDGLESSQIARSRGQDYSILEPLKMWEDVLSSGQSPGDVAMLCLGGGEISFMEMMLAVAIGADAYFLPDGRNGGAASSLAGVLEEAGGAPALPHLRILPDDDATLAMFRPWGAVADSCMAENCELLARKIHEDYVRDCVGKASNSSLAPWERLRDDFKFSNMHQAANSIRILAASGYGVRRLRPGEDMAELPDISGSVEDMSRLEHGRWNVERLMQGWRHGNAKDIEKRISPCIAPWDALTEDVKDYDRRAVRDWPQLLLDAGLVVYKKDANAGESR